MIVGMAPHANSRWRAWVCVAGALVAALGLPGAAQQREAPQTGAPRRSWPQRPGSFRLLQVHSPADVRPSSAANEPAFVANEVLVQFQPDVAETDRAAARDAAGAVLERTLRAGGGRLERLTT